MNAAEWSEAKKQIARFFGTRRYVYATPGTINHSANFYGYDAIIKLTRTDVLGCVETARDGWTHEDGESFDLNDVIEQVFDDLQYDRPK